MPIIVAFMAALCRAAYAKGKSKEEHHRQLRLDLRALGLESFHIFDVNGVQGFVAWNETLYVEIFRGSDEPLDWIRNFFVHLTSAFGGQIHTGFLNGVEDVWKDLCALRKAHAEGKMHLIAGHSLGAAMATVARARCASETIHVEGVYCFGGPRVGDPVFARSIEAAPGTRIFRFVNKLDAVPSVPFTYLRISAWRTKYMHVGTFFHLTGNGFHQIEKRARVRLREIAAAALTAVIHKFRYGGSWKSVAEVLVKARTDDHSMNSYVLSLDACLQPIQESENNDQTKPFDSQGESTL